MLQCDVLLHAGVIITQDASHRILEHASIAILDGKIADIGPTEEMETWQATEVMDLKHTLVMPGLINSHTHGAMTFLRGLADDLPLMTWLENTVFPVEAQLTREITRMGSLLGYAEMLASGTTACMDMYLFEDAVLEAAEIAGIRCTGGEAVFGFPSASCRNWQEALDSTKNLAIHYKDNDRINIAVNPHSVYTTNAEILCACRDAALEMNLPLHIHLAETVDETKRSLEMHGKKPVEYCADLGLFQCKVAAAHLVDITYEEAYLLASNGVCGVHNPISNMKLASGIAPVKNMLTAGLNLGLGTDGPASNNTLNMFTEMRQAALLHKLANKNPADMPATLVLDMATHGGAAVLRNPAIGSLEKGMQADCIALDLKAPNMQPLYNPISQVVYAASGHECVMSMVSGETLYKDGKYTRFDYSDILDYANELKGFVLRKIKGGR